MRIILVIVYDVVRVLYKSRYTLASELLYGVKKRVDYEVSLYQQKYDGLAALDVIVVNDTLDIDTNIVNQIHNKVVGTNQVNVIYKTTSLHQHTTDDDLNNSIFKT